MVALFWVALLGLAALAILLPDDPTRQNTAPAALQAREASGTPAQANKTDRVRIYGTAWGLTLSVDGSGIYNELLRAALAGSDVPAIYDIRPYRRAKALFERDTASCLYPSNIDLLVSGGDIEDPGAYRDSAGLLHVKVFVFAAHGQTPPASIRDIDNRSVAYAMGSRMPYFMRDTVGAEFIAVADETDKARMLITGRVDLMTAALPDAKFVFDQLGAPLPPFDPAYELNDTLVRVTCHDTPATRRFLEAFDQSLLLLQDSGGLDALLSNHDLAPNLYAPRSLDAPAPAGLRAD